MNVDDETIVDEQSGAVRKIYIVSGPLFFGTVTPLMHLLQVNVADDPDDVEIHLQRTAIFDYSAVDALNEIGAKYRALGKRMHLRNLSLSSMKIVAKMRGMVQFRYGKFRLFFPSRFVLTN